MCLNLSIQRDFNKMSHFGTFCIHEYFPYLFRFKFIYTLHVSVLKGDAFFLFYLVLRYVLQHGPNNQMYFIRTMESYSHKADAVAIKYTAGQFFFLKRIPPPSPPHTNAVITDIQNVWPSRQQ